jgi:4-hydroxy-tetrahydrodipicolinate reductase
MGAARLAVFGITGRMGQSLIRALREADAPLRLSGALASANSALLGRDAALEGAPSGVTITAAIESALSGAEVAIDFSVSSAVLPNARACAAARVPLLVGTTGLTADLREGLRQAARDIAVLVAPNTSVGVALIARLVRLAAAALPGFDVEILDVHHADKRDAPSGTALALGESVAAARGRTLSEIAVYERHGDAAARQPGSVGFASLRGGDVIGEHTVLFTAPGERVEITHRASDRQIFAKGALRAAAWLPGKAPGLYGMQDVLQGEIGIDSDRAHR